MIKPNNFPQKYIPVKNKNLFTLAFRPPCVSTVLPVYFLGPTLIQYTYMCNCVLQSVTRLRLFAKKYL